jgi:hypothetical protein
MRILNWFFSGNPDMPAFYAESDYTPTNIRLYSKNAPGVACQVDIKDDGVSILENYAELAGEETLEDVAGNFLDTVIEAGSVITCHIIQSGGVGSLSVQLEMETHDDFEDE